MTAAAETRTATNSLLIAAGKMFRLGSVGPDGEVMVATSRERATAARKFPGKVSRRRFKGTTWLLVDASLRAEAEAAEAIFLASKARPLPNAESCPVCDSTNGKPARAQRKRSVDPLAAFFR